MGTTDEWPMLLFDFACHLCPMAARGYKRALARITDPTISDFELIHEQHSRYDEGAGLSSRPMTGKDFRDGHSDRMSSKAKRIAVTRLRASVERELTSDRFIFRGMRIGKLETIRLAGHHAEVDILDDLIKDVDGRHWYNVTVRPSTSLANAVRLPRTNARQDLIKKLLKEKYVKGGTFRPPCSKEMQTALEAAGVPYSIRTLGRVVSALKKEHP